MPKQRKTVENTKINPSRRYVIVSNAHSGAWAGCVLFWGHITEDDEERSFGGYTCDVDAAERYSPQDLESGNWHFEIFNKDTMTVNDFLERRDIAVLPEELEQLGYKPIRVMYRP